MSQIAGVSIAVLLSGLSGCVAHDSETQVSLSGTSSLAISFVNVRNSTGMIRATLCSDPESLSTSFIVWPATDMAQRDVSRLSSHNFAHAIQHVPYANAGHAVYVGGTQDPGGFSNMRAVFGGTVEADRAAWQDSWPRVLSFFTEHLQR